MDGVLWASRDRGHYTAATVADVGVVELMISVDSVCFVQTR